MVYGIYNELVTGAFVNQLITWGASYCTILMENHNFLWDNSL